jgi:hypothetical protein
VPTCIRLATPGLRKRLAASFLALSIKRIQQFLSVKEEELIGKGEKEKKKNKRI